MVRFQRGRVITTLTLHTQRHTLGFRLPNPFSLAHHPGSVRWSRQQELHCAVGVSVTTDPQKDRQEGRTTGRTKRKEWMGRKEKRVGKEGWMDGWTGRKKGGRQ